ncbi:MAG: hypothetical protein A2283_04900 [Lentisphaerae bacterium RIFOXYA12_FULL_48_11]|nr:MAG: hypothetical protein A2283_04900 [Lentisphaerae bacterium RIFOXYA12_FULL_48_11]
MSLRLFYSFIAVLMMCLCAFCQEVEGPRPIEDVYKILLDHNIAFDLNKTRRATVEGLIKAVDSGAMLLTAEQFHAMMIRTSVEKVEEWPEDICYLKVRGIFRDAGDEIIEHLKKWNDSGKAGVIMDLRGSGGESLPSVDRIAALYVSDDPLLYLLKDGRGEIIQTHRLSVDNETLDGNIPLLLLVDKATTAASELLVAILKNRKGVLVIGVSTSGDISYRENVPLSQDEILHIVTRRVYVNGVQYEGVGVLPDVAVNSDGVDGKRKLPPKVISIKPESAKAKSDRDLMEKVFPDPVLLRATDILLAMKATVTYGKKTTVDTPSPTGIH